MKELVELLSLSGKESGDDVRAGQRVQVPEHSLCPAMPPRPLQLLIVLGQLKPDLATASREAFMSTARKATHFPPAPLAAAWVTYTL